MRIACDIDETSLPDPDGYPVMGVCATCHRCGHSTETYGTSDASIRRCLATMREECPNDEQNFYRATE